MELKFCQTISELKPRPGLTILGTIEKLYPERYVPEPNRINVKSKYDCKCFYCKKKISEGDWIKWAMGSNETLHLDCESQYEKDHGQTIELNKVRDALFSDATGKIILTLWKTDTNRFSVGDKIIVENGYVYNFKKELHISAGYHGNLSEILKTRGRNYHEEQRQREQQEKPQREEQTSKIDDEKVIEAFVCNHCKKDGGYMNGHHDICEKHYINNIRNKGIQKNNSHCQCDNLGHSWGTVVDYKKPVTDEQMEDYKIVNDNLPTSRESEFGCVY